MQDLAAVSGLPLYLDDSGQVRFGPGVLVDETKARFFDELVPVALDPASCRGRRDAAYYMYNGVYRQADRSRLQSVPMRYELTLIPPFRMGREFIKTLGHIHRPDPATGMSHAEVCEVLAGTAHFIFQTLNIEGPDAGRVVCVEARAGQKVIIPPDLDHCTINPGPGPLLFSDVVSLALAGNYDRYRAAHGAAYFEIARNAHGEFIPNPAYRRVAPLERATPGDYPGLNLTRDVPLYTAFLEQQGANWPFLLDPSRFGEAFPDLPPGPRTEQ